MSEGRDKYKKLLDKIEQLTGNDPEFRKAMEERFFSSISRNIEEIRDILRIKERQSIDYSFIPDKYKILREQLIIDNLRMENSRYDLKSDEFERFYNFCTCAFLQIENLINYYYYRRFPDFNDFLLYLERTPKTYFKRSPIIKTINDITIAIKIYSFNLEHFPHPDSNNKKYNKTNFNLQNLREVRNEGFHRCSVLYNNKTETIENSELHSFFKLQTFFTVRNTINAVVNVIKPKVEYKKAVIHNLLPSACYIKYENNEVVDVPFKLIKDKDFKIGDNISVCCISDFENNTIKSIKKI